MDEVEFGRHLADSRPVGALDARGAVPFRVGGEDETAIVCRRHAGAAEFLGLRRAVPRLGAVVLLLLFDADSINRDLDRLRRRGARFVEVPHPQSVVAIERLDDIVPRVELHAHLAEIVAEKPADLAADQGIVQTLPCLGEQRAALADEAVRVLVIRVEQSAAEPGEKAPGRSPRWTACATWNGAQSERRPGSFSQRERFDRAHLRPR